MSRLILRLLVVSFVLVCIFPTAAGAQTFSTPWMHATNQDWASEWGVLDPMILFAPWILGSAERGDRKLGWRA